LEGGGFQEFDTFFSQGGFFYSGHILLSNEDGVWFRLHLENWFHPLMTLFRTSPLPYHIYDPLPLLLPTPLLLLNLLKLTPRTVLYRLLPIPLLRILQPYHLLLPHLRLRHCLPLRLRLLNHLPRPPLLTSNYFFDITLDFDLFLQHLLMCLQII
jgi:hypothetical protein